MSIDAPAPGSDIPEDILASAIAGENVRRLFAGELRGFPDYGTLVSRVFIELDWDTRCKISEGWPPRQLH